MKQTLDKGITIIEHLQVYERLQKVNVTMSHQVTIRLLTKLGARHDEVVKRWQDALARLVADVHAKVRLLQHIQFTLLSSVD